MGACGMELGAQAPYALSSLTHAHSFHTPPGPAASSKPRAHAAGRRCGALEARRSNAASL